VGAEWLVARAPRRSSPRLPARLPRCRPTTPRGAMGDRAERHERGARYPYRSPVISRSFVRLWRALTRRTVPDRARMTIDSVVAVEPS
jgi:hypothetical protein